MPEPEPEVTLTYEEWVERYRPVFTEHGDLDQLPAVPVAADLRYLWAVVEADGEWAILPGWHIVNVMYYVRTTEPHDFAPITVDWGD